MIAFDFKIAQSAPRALWFGRLSKLLKILLLVHLAGYCNLRQKMRYKNSDNCPLSAVRNFPSNIYLLNFLHVPYTSFYRLRACSVGVISPETIARQARLHLEAAIAAVRGGMSPSQGPETLSPPSLYNTPSYYLCTECSAASLPS